ncbi:MAG: D-2-hydroxyacid dehydrogenase, partial [Armatimonadota bacterium]|nr:D-2-hydroxyacid dehydrogenase [Armatimonadota bacterium]
MRIVVLDGFTLNPGDLSWDALRKLGECTIYDRTSPNEVVPRAQNAPVVLTNKAVLSRATITTLPELRYIGVTATGYNVVDVETARERGIVVTNVPAYGTRSVAQMVFALLLELTQHVGHHAQTVREGRWSQSADWCYWDFPLVELDGLTLGIIGYGRIGQEVARLGRAFGMNVLAFTRTPEKHPADEVQFVNLDELFTGADVVSLHCPLTPETQSLINAKRLAQMKPTAFLLNTARGPLVDEKALAEALNAGRIAGAGLDVLEQEPPPADLELRRLSNVILTPHTAYYSDPSGVRLRE